MASTLLSLFVMSLAQGSTLQNFVVQRDVVPEDSINKRLSPCACRNYCMVHSTCSTFAVQLSEGSYICYYSISEVKPLKMKNVEGAILYSNEITNMLQSEDDTKSIAKERETTSNVFDYRSLFSTASLTSMQSKINSSDFPTLDSTSAITNHSTLPLGIQEHRTAFNISKPKLSTVTPLSTATPEYELVSQTEILDATQNKSAQIDLTTQKTLTPTSSTQRKFSVREASTTVTMPTQEVSTPLLPSSSKTELSTSLKSSTTAAVSKTTPSLIETTSPFKTTTLLSRKSASIQTTSMPTTVELKTLTTSTQNASKLTQLISSDSIPTTTPIHESTSTTVAPTSKSLTTVDVHSNSAPVQITTAQSELQPFTSTSIMPVPVTSQTATNAQKTSELKGDSEYLTSTVTFSSMRLSITPAPSSVPVSMSGISTPLATLQVTQIPSTPNLSISLTSTTNPSTSSPITNHSTSSPITNPSTTNSSTKSIKEQATSMTMTSPMLVQASSTPIPSKLAETPLSSAKTESITSEPYTSIATISKSSAVLSTERPLPSTIQTTPSPSQAPTTNPTSIKSTPYPTSTWPPFSTTSSTANVPLVTTATKLSSLSTSKLAVPTSIQTELPSTSTLKQTLLSLITPSTLEQKEFITTENSLDQASPTMPSPTKEPLSTIIESTSESTLPSPQTKLAQVSAISTFPPLTTYTSTIISNTPELKKSSLKTTAVSSKLTPTISNIVAKSQSTTVLNVNPASVTPTLKASTFESETLHATSTIQSPISKSATMPSSTSTTASSPLYTLLPTTIPEKKLDALTTLHSTLPKLSSASTSTSTSPKVFTPAKGSLDSTKTSDSAVTSETTTTPQMSGKYFISSTASTTGDLATIEKICMREGGSLAVVASQEDYENLKKSIIFTSRIAYWTGLKVMGNDQFEWYTGLKYSDTELPSSLIVASDKPCMRMYDHLFYQLACTASETGVLCQK